MEEFIFLILLAIFAVLGAIAYFTPAIIAVYLQHPHTVGLVVFNLLLGWTLMGWGAALVWSLWPEIRKAMKDQERSG